MDRWDIWNQYLTSIFELSKTNTHVNNHTTAGTENHEDNDLTLDGSDDTPEKAHEFICSVIENIGDDNLFKSSSSKCVCYSIELSYCIVYVIVARLPTARTIFGAF